MKILTLIAALFVAVFCYSQDQQGYYITKNNEKVEGYYKSTDFFDPTSLLFKKTADGEFIKINTADVIEYSVGDEYKFKKFTVKLDKSNFNLKKLSTVKEPEWETVTIFLNVLVDGNAILYSYPAYNGVKYFFTVKGKQELPEQLVFKKYSPNEYKMSENNYFRQQLFNLVNCDNEAVDKFLKILYNEKSLIPVFNKYNKCSGLPSTQFANATGKKAHVSLNVFAGVYNTQFGINHASPSITSVNTVSIIAGGEGVFAFATGKWEVFARLEYEKIVPKEASGKTAQINSVDSRFKINTDALNIFLGPRYNFILNETNKIFVDGAVGFSVPFGSIDRKDYISNGTGEFLGVNESYKSSAALCGNFELGYVYNNTLGISLGYVTNRNLFSNLGTSMTTKLSRFGINVRYTIL